MHDLCTTNDSTAEQDANAWAMWMWVRENRLVTQIFWDQTTCANFSESNFYDTSGSQSEFNWNTSSGFCCGGGNCTLGLQTEDSSDFCSNGHEHYNKTDIWFSSNDFLCLNPASHTNVGACIWAGFPYRENVALHEHGHSYNLEHWNSIPSVMNSSVLVRGCHEGSNFHTEPDGDSVNGIVQNNGRNTDNETNASAMIWTGSNGAIARTSFDLASGSGYCGQAFPIISYTATNFYRPISNMPYDLYLVPGTGRPTPANAIYLDGSYVTLNRGQNLTVAETITSFPATVLAPGVNYRVWIWVDRWNTESEIDEGDNMIPMDVRFRRGAACGG